MRNKSFYIFILSILIIISSCEKKEKLTREEENNSTNINLKPYRPDMTNYIWDDVIIVKNSVIEDGYRDMYDDIIYAGGDINICCAFVNDGDEDLTKPISNNIYIDGNLVKTIEWDNTLQSKYFWMHWNHIITGLTLSEGQHTVKLVIDGNNDINETNENDNEYSKTFTVSSAETMTIRVTNRGSSGDDVPAISTETGGSGFIELTTGSYFDFEVNSNNPNLYLWTCDPDCIWKPYVTPTNINSNLYYDENTRKLTFTRID